MKQLYYEELKEAQWKKNMGAVVKMMSGKTGISDALKKLESAFDKIDWDVFEPQIACKGLKTEEAFQEKLDDAVKLHSGELQKFRKQVTDVQKLASDTAAEFKKDKLIPKGSREYVEKIAARAKEMFEDLGQPFIRIIEKDFETVKGQKLKGVQVGREKLESYGKKFAAALKKCREDTAKAEEDQEKLSLYTSFRREYLRGFGTALPFFKDDPELGPHYKPWFDLSQDKADPKDVSKIEPLLDYVEKKWNELEKSLKKKGYV